MKKPTRELVRTRSKVRKWAAVAATASTVAFLSTTLTAAAARADSSPFPGSSCAPGSVDGQAFGPPMCFGTMFPQLAPFHYSDQAAADLAQTELNPVPDPAGVDRGTPDDSATLPAEYTYLGQFIDHNLDFDNTPQPTANVNPRTLTNSETFRFDLNNVFGNGPFGDPQLYAPDHRHLLVSGTLGTPQPDGFPTVTGNNGVFDLFRNAAGVADLVEPRDDENQILSQIAAAFVAFYNNFINQGMSYTQARQLTENYYQEIVLTDVLPAYVGQGTINRYLHTGVGGTFVNTPNLPYASFTPIEFSVGAYRFGHSLVRNTYHINDILPTTVDYDNNVPIFDVNAFQYGDLTGGAPLEGPAADAANNCEATNQTNLLCELPTDHQIMWKYFVPELDKNPTDAGINFARATQPTISPALFNLPANTIPGCVNAVSPVCNGTADLIARDYARGNYDGLASGQAFARALGCPVIPAASINPTRDAVFNTGTPLLYYVLVEAKQSGQTLGCVGKSIVAQTYIQVLWDTPGSILHTGFRPNPSLVKLAPETPAFSFGDLLVDTGLAPRFS